MNVTNDNKMETAAQRYQQAFGWQVDVRGSQLLLQLDDVCTAFVLRHNEVERISRQIAEWGDPCPVLFLPEKPRKCIVLVDARDHLLALNLLPENVEMWAQPLLPLPPSTHANGNVYWLRSPDWTRRWLPTAAAVLCAARPRILRSTSRPVEPRDRTLMTGQSDLSAEASPSPA